MSELIGPALFFIYFLSGMERLNAGEDKIHSLSLSLSRLFAFF